MHWGRREGGHGRDGNPAVSLSCRDRQGFLSINALVSSQKWNNKRVFRTFSGLFHAWMFPSLTTARLRQENRPRDGRERGGGSGGVIETMRALNSTEEGYKMGLKEEIGGWEIEIENSRDWKIHKVEMAERLSQKWKNCLADGQNSDCSQILLCQANSS